MEGKGRAAERDEDNQEGPPQPDDTTDPLPTQAMFIPVLEQELPPM